MENQANLGILPEYYISSVEITVNLRRLLQQVYRELGCFFEISCHYREKRVSRQIRKDYWFINTIHAFQHFTRRKKLRERDRRRKRWLRYARFAARDR